MNGIDEHIGQTDCILNIAEEAAKLIYHRLNFCTNIILLRALLSALPNRAPIYCD